MTSAAGGERTRSRARQFVPIEDAPGSGLTPRAREVLALAISAFGLYGLLCLATFRDRGIGSDRIPGDGSNVGGAFGYYLANGFCFVFGFAAWIPFLLLLVYAVGLFLHRRFERPVIKLLGGLVFTAMMALLLAGPGGGAGVSDLTPWGGGGRFGGNLSPRLFATFGGSGRILLVSFGALVSFLLVTEWLFTTVLERSAQTIDRLWRQLLHLPLPAEGAGLPAGAVARLLDAALDDAPGRLELDDDEGPRPRRRLRADADADADAEATALTGSGSGDDDAVPGAAPKPRRGRGAGGEREVEDADALPAVAPQPALPAVELPRPKVVVAKKPKPKPKPRAAAQSELPFDAQYPFPPVELFREPAQTDVGATAQVLQRGSDAIVLKLASFGLTAEVVSVSVGPAVAQYELRLAEGIRVGKIVGFEADLAAALKAVAVRVVAPIPGKDTIGIEVPNQERQRVFLRELLDQYEKAEDLAIPLFLGKDVAGNAIVEDLTRMPHLLIAGTTGSGKSVCINAILLSILMTRTPAQVRLILVDPKMVELQAYKNVPHLCCEVVTSMKKAPAVLQWAVDEMENRYALLSAAGTNHIRSYNRLGQQELQKRLRRELEPDRVHLPYIVLVIDELADLMSVAANEVEESIQRLAQKSRSVGMHVILATQRPSTDVITGVIKANLPCQIAFKVSRKIDSRVILDANGAEKLLGYGDMLYVPPGGGALVRAQGTFVAEEELQAVVQFLEQQGQLPNFLPELMQTQSGGHESMADKDPLYREAVEIILGQQRGSATLLQRALSVGYTRATRLLEMMEEDGLVGPFVGSKSREVMFTIDEWKAREAAIAEELAAAEDAAGASAPGIVESVETSSTAAPPSPTEDAAES